MKLREVYHVGGLTQSFSGLAPFLDRTNCEIVQKTKSDSSVVCVMKRHSDGAEGRSRLRVLDQFKSIEEQLLNRAFANQAMIGQTLNELSDMELGFHIESLQGKLSIVEDNHL